MIRENRDTTQADKELEHVMVTLPKNAVEIFANQVSTQSGLPGGLSHIESLSEAQMGRNGLFPHIKKTRYSDQIELKIVHNNY